MNIVPTARFDSFVGSPAGPAPTGRRPNFWSEPYHYQSKVRPVFVEDLPSEREIALSGLEPLWRKVLFTLREVDAKEP